MQVNINAIAVPALLRIACPANKVLILSSSNGLDVSAL
ncbi:BgTH12-02388 [Blumeria graminis f. sp. triticale]|uniref:BgTH12-02388 n=1 Tax=Blumeria graminis f. sp. triticale TaxID=1689686 RepID=A0A9W4GE32_BLUGR|nr:BgTH12-02388 [Blumeria graminis f. sp. triticale]